MGRHSGKVSGEAVARAVTHVILAGRNELIHGAEGRAGSNLLQLWRQLERRVREHQLPRGVSLEVVRVAVDEAAADVHLLEVHPDGVETPGALHHGGTIRHPGALHGLLQPLQIDDIRQMGIRGIAAWPQCPEEENRGLHGVWRKGGAHLQAIHLVPCFLLQVVRLEEILKTALVHAEQGGELLLDRGAYHRRGEVANAPIRAHQRGKPAEVVIMRVRLEDALDLRDADAQALDAVENVRARVYQVGLPLEDENTRHRRPVRVPPVALPRVDDGEVATVNPVEAQGVGRLILLVGLQVQIHGERLTVIEELEDVQGAPAQENAVPDLHRVTPHHHGVDQLV